MSQLEYADARPRQESLVELWRLSLARVDRELGANEAKLRASLCEDDESEYRSLDRRLSPINADLRDQRDVLTRLLKEAGAY